jgi:hypothetical protein
MRVINVTGLSVLAASLMSVSPVAAQNMEAMAKWGTAKVVHFHLSGDYNGTVMILKGNDSQGSTWDGTVADHVEVDFDWDQTQAKFVGEPVIKNFPTKVVSVAVYADCPAVTVNGPFEFATVQSMTAMVVMAKMQSVRSYPGGVIPAMKQEAGAKCGSLMVTAPAQTESVTLPLQIPQVMMLAMPATPGFEMEISKDHTSFIQKVNTDGWVWTMTPTIVK